MAEFEVIWRGVGQIGQVGRVGQVGLMGGGGEGDFKFQIADCKFRYGSSTSDSELHYLWQAQIRRIWGWLQPDRGAAEWFLTAARYELKIGGCSCENHAE